jgi:hypothetical protein
MTAKTNNSNSNSNSNGNSNNNGTATAAAKARAGGVRGVGSREWWGWRRPGRGVHHFVR